MSDVIEFQLELPDGVMATYVSIPIGDGLTTMLKSIYDEQQAAQKVNEAVSK